MEVIAIVVLYNPSVSTIIRQYKSLINQVSEIAYIDNGSKNIQHVTKSIKEHSVPKLPYIIIENNKNLGLGYAHNQGIKYAENKKYELLLILDHDSILKENFVNNLVKCHLELCRQFKVGAVGPIYVNEETNEIYPITKYWGPFIKRLKPTVEPEEASCLISSGTLISLPVLAEVGGMNEDLFVDYIDIEWSYRARSKGYKLFAVPSAVMNHKIGDKRISLFGRKISMHSPLRRYYLTRNSIYMLRCPYISFGYKLREFTFNIVRIITFSIISSNRNIYLKYSIKGLFDGLKGRFGEYRD